MLFPSIILEVRSKNICMLFQSILYFGMFEFYKLIVAFFFLRAAEFFTCNAVTFYEDFVQLCLALDWTVMASMTKHKYVAIYKTIYL